MDKLWSTIHVHLVILVKSQIHYRQNAIAAVQDFTKIFKGRVIVKDVQMDIMLSFQVIQFVLSVRQEKLQVLNKINVFTVEKVIIKTYKASLIVRSVHQGILQILKVK